MGQGDPEGGRTELAMTAFLPAFQKIIQALKAEERNPTAHGPLSLGRPCPEVSRQQRGQGGLCGGLYPAMSQAAQPGRSQEPGMHIGGLNSAWTHQPPTQRGFLTPNRLHIMWIEIH